MMARTVDLPDSLPLFPLAGAVLMPRMRLPLQIFEPRYLQMVEDALRTPERLIAMIQPAENSDNGLAQIGCAGRIVSFTELDDHRMMIALRAVSRFRLVEAEVLCPLSAWPGRLARLCHRSWPASRNRGRGLRPAGTDLAPCPLCRAARTDHRLERRRGLG